jgi:hypothetical protein
MWLGRCAPRWLAAGPVSPRRRDMPSAEAYSWGYAPGRKGLQEEHDDICRTIGANA